MPGSIWTMRGTGAGRGLPPSARGEVREVARDRAEARVHFVDYGSSSLVALGMVGALSSHGHGPVSLRVL